MLVEDGLALFERPVAVGGGATDALILQQGFSCGGLVAVLCLAGGLSGESCLCGSVGNRRQQAEIRSPSHVAAVFFEQEGDEMWFH